MQSLTAKDLARLTPEERVIALQRAIELETLRIRCEGSLAGMFRFVWSVLEPGRELIWSWPLDLICRFLEDFSRRKFTRGIINLPPRGTKSLLVGVAYPLWVWIQAGVDSKYGGPGHQFLSLAHSQGLAVRDGEKARIVLESPKFAAIWGDRVQIQQGQNEKANYVLVGNGHRNSFGITAQFQGRGGDTILIDDPNDPEVVYSDVEREKVNESYQNKVPNRLNDRATGGIMIIMQRLQEQDLTGFVIKNGGLYHPTDNPGGWMHLVLPGEFLLDGEDGDVVNPAGQWGYADLRTELGEILYPERFPPHVMAQVIRDYGGKDTYGYSGQIQQRPFPPGGGIIKRQFWRRWPTDQPLPHCDHVFLSWDTAMSEREEKDRAYSAMTAWGVFFHEGMQATALLCLGAWWGRVGFPDLKILVREKEEFFGVDAHLIEAAVSGISLIQELKRTKTSKGQRIRLRGMRPRQLGDKSVRAHAASSAFQGGLIFLPTPAHTDSQQIHSGDLTWVKDLVDYVSKFPRGTPPCRDLTDTVTQAVIYFQRGYWISHPDDVEGDNYIGAAADAPEDEDDPPQTYLGVYG